MEKFIYRGSVKDIYSNSEDEENLLFKFSNRYSIFDWGEMPDELKDKGKALSFYTHFIFKEFSKPVFWQKIESKLPADLSKTDTYKDLCIKGMCTHLIGYASDEGKQVDSITTNLKVKKVNIIKPEYNVKDNSWDYSKYLEKPNNCLVPLEVIFRFGVPRGSSLLARVKNPEYAKGLGLSKVPVEGEKFAIPVVEFSTKLEERDKYLTRKDAYATADLSPKEQIKLENTSSLLAFGIKHIFEEINIELWDGKFEFAFCPSEIANERELMLVDAIGPDELRLSYKEMPLSKENLRQCYIGSPWHLAVNEAKKLASERSSAEWKDICLNELKQTPPKLTQEKLYSFEMLYKVMANELARKFLGTENLFNINWNLDDLRYRLKGLGL